MRFIFQVSLSILYALTTASSVDFFTIDHLQLFVNDIPLNRNGSDFTSPDQQTTLSLGTITPHANGVRFQLTAPAASTEEVGITESLAESSVQCTYDPAKKIVDYIASLNNLSLQATRKATLDSFYVGNTEVTGYFEASAPMKFWYDFMSDPENHQITLRLKYYFDGSENKTTQYKALHRFDHKRMGVTDVKDIFFCDQSGNCRSLKKTTWTTQSLEFDAWTTLNTLSFPHKTYSHLIHSEPEGYFINATLRGKYWKKGQLMVHMKQCNYVFSDGGSLFIAQKDEHDFKAVTLQGESFKEGQSVFYSVLLRPTLMRLVLTEPHVQQNTFFQGYYQLVSNTILPAAKYEQEWKSVVPHDPSVRISATQPIVRSIDLTVILASDQTKHLIPLLFLKFKHADSPIASRLTVRMNEIPDPKKQRASEIALLSLSAGITPDIGPGLIFGDFSAVLMTRLLNFVPDIPCTGSLFHINQSHGDSIEKVQNFQVEALMVEGEITDTFCSALTAFIQKNTVKKILFSEAQSFGSLSPAQVTALYEALATTASVQEVHLPHLWSYDSDRKKDSFAKNPILQNDFFGKLRGVKGVNYHRNISKYLIQVLRNNKAFIQTLDLSYSTFDPENWDIIIELIPQLTALTKLSCHHVNACNDRLVRVGMAIPSTVAHFELQMPESNVLWDIATLNLSETVDASWVRRCVVSTLLAPLAVTISPIMYLQGYKGVSYYTLMCFLAEHKKHLTKFIAHIQGPIDEEYKRQAAILPSSYNIEHKSL